MTNDDLLKAFVPESTSYLGQRGEIRDGHLIRLTDEQYKAIRALISEAPENRPKVDMGLIDYICEEMELAITSRSAKGSEQRMTEEKFIRWAFEKAGIDVEDK
jgi:hypothetical protein